MWRKTETGAIYRTHHEIRSAHSQISMPAVLTDDVIASLGIESLPQEDWPAPSIEESAQAIQSAFEAEIAAIKEGYTPDEISSWPYQTAEARAWETDNNAPTPLIDAILVNRGGTKDELVARILTNSAAYAQAFGEALGRKQASIAALNAE